MNNFFKKLTPVHFIGLFFSIFLCTISPTDAALKVGVTAGPHAMIMDKVKDLASQEGLLIDVIEFNDFILPNAALDEGSIDINAYQHHPFLNHQITIRGYKLASIGKTVLMPFGIYAHKIKNMADIPNGARVAVPNDPANGARALRLLETAGLITLTENPMPSILDIISNIKNLTFIELDAPQLPRSLDDVDLAVINTDWIILAKMDPSTALYKESTDSPYTNIIAVRQEDAERADLQNFVKIYQSPTIKKYILETFHGAVIPAW